MTLILAVSPRIGLIYYEIHEGPVTAYIFCRFAGQLFEAAKVKFGLSPEQANFVKIPIIYDNARIHHSKKLDDLLQQQGFLEWFHLEFLPPYSPMLNIVEEVNRDLKYNALYAHQNNRRFKKEKLASRMKEQRAIQEVNRLYLVEWHSVECVWRLFQDHRILE